MIAGGGRGTSRDQRESDLISLVQPNQPAHGVAQQSFRASGIAVAQGKPAGIRFGDCRETLVTGRFGVTNAIRIGLEASAGRAVAA